MEQGKNNAPYTEKEEAEIEKAWEEHKKKIPWFHYTEAHVDFWAGANAAATVLRKKEHSLDEVTSGLTKEDIESVHKKLKELSELPCPLCQGSGCPVCLPQFTS